MKIKTCIFLLIAVTFSLQTFSQKVSVNVYWKHKTAAANSDTIYYDSQRKLSWSDFQGKAPINSPWGAMTASGFSFSSEMNDDGENIDISVGVFAFFTKHDSWKKPYIHSDEHLLHEQHHFDITMLGVAKLMDEIKKATFTATNFRPLLRSLFNKAYAENIALQQQYDRETRNSLDVEKQKEWNQRIENEIANYKEELRIKN
jgi:hypothetical protein